MSVTSPTTTAGGKKTINFPTFYMIVRMITLLCNVSLSVVVFQRCMAMEARVIL